MEASHRSHPVVRELSFDGLLLILISRVSSSQTPLPRSTLLCITSRQPDRFSSEQASDESERNISSTDHHQAGVDLSASYASRSVCEALDLTCLICRDLHQTQDTVYCKHWDLGSFSVMLCKLLGINILSSTNCHSHPFTIIFHKHKPEY